MACSNLTARCRYLRMSLIKYMTRHRTNYNDRHVNDSRRLWRGMLTELTKRRSRRCKIDKKETNGLWCITSDAADNFRFFFLDATSVPEADELCFHGHGSYRSCPGINSQRKKLYASGRHHKSGRWKMFGRHRRDEPQFVHFHAELWSGMMKSVIRGRWSFLVSGWSSSLKLRITYSYYATVIDKNRSRSK